MNETLERKKGLFMTNDWQYSNQFFIEGKEHFESGGAIKDCPYDYLSVDQSNEKLVQSEHYRMREWLCGFRQAYQDSIAIFKEAV